MEGVGVLSICQKEESWQTTSVDTSVTIVFPKGLLPIIGAAGDMDVLRNV